ncbi:GAF domain-containing sensor histidine kinase [Spirulina sp. CS-785/01]|uniref:GAF domain-containing sensor histidine kinase n=1 Tax=Spirulina sp. CS-785/01 TaxID=3021716 RepID=UPI00232FA0A1|nr:GAF domain-containing sensor histidine kinase [Spirulina sp. CS-785/01]MDB9314429.1 GAF domain-containing sensor histidine kinase [Spirulina sp. CS-785/01]
MMNEQDSQQVQQQITQWILSNVSSPTLLNTVAQRIGTALGAIACLIDSHPPAGIIHEQYYDFLDLQGYWCAEKKRQTLIKQQLQEQESEETTPSSHSTSQPLSKILRQPLLGGGLLLLGYRHPPQQLPTSEVLAAMAQTVAIALSHRHQQAQIDFHQQYQRLLQTLSTTTHQAGDVQDILEITLAESSKVLKVERSLVILLKYQDIPSKTRSSRTFSKAKGNLASQWRISRHVSPVHLTQEFKLGDCPTCTKAWQLAPDPLAIADTYQFTDSISPCFNPEEFRALLIVPLLSLPRSSHDTPTVLGFLFFQHCQPHQWQPDELNCVKGISSQVSTAITYHRTLSQVQSLVDERTIQLQRSLDVQAKLYEKTRQQIDQLRHLVQVKDEFLDSVSHELRTPLTTMKMAIQMLRQEELPLARRQKYLTLLEQEWNREYHLIQDLLTLQKLESKQITIQVQPIEIQPLFERFKAEFDNRWLNKGLKLNLGFPSSKAPLLLYSDAESFDRIIQELLTNAGKYSDPDTQVLLEVSLDYQTAMNQIVFSLTNYGKGIPPEEQTEIFEKFRRGKGITENAVAGTGLGLALVRSWVQHLNGTITVESQVGTQKRRGKTCFLLTLPQRPSEGVLVNN